MKKMYVWITFSFVAFHNWPGAYEKVDFLRDVHRHVFHVKMKWFVRHNDRDIEFTDKKEEVEEWVRMKWCKQNVGKSCEMMAEELVDKFGACFACVSEDNENGAEVCVDEV